LHAALHCSALIIRQLLEQLKRSALVGQILDLLECGFAQDERLDLEPPPVPILDPASSPGVGELVARDAEQPRAGRCRAQDRTCERSPARSRTPRRSATPL
jgi:hypothetical protein